MNDLFSKIEQIEQSLQQEFEAINDFIFRHPELGGEEYISVKYLTDVLSQYGFEITMPYCDLDTAFRAEFGDREETKIAFLAEYDALKGMGEKGEPAHGCGHNWIAASSVGAAIVLSQLKDEFKGQIVVLGTPAEETFGAKVDMVERGAFDDIDIVIQGHLGNENILNTQAMAMNSLEFRFTGKPAHAAAYPYNGVNALDAVQLTFAGVNALRQHIRPEARIHGIVSNGGAAANIIPDQAACKLTMRASSSSYLEEITQKVKNCAKGAALMTGTTMEYGKFENSFLDMVNIPSLQEIMKEGLTKAGIENLLEEEVEPKGSTDIGNVSYQCPTSYVQLDVEGDEPFLAHEQSAVSLSNSSYAMKKLHQAIQAFAYTGLYLFLNEKKIEEIKEEHQKILAKKGGEVL